jgi:hypothetical protein
MAKRNMAAKKTVKAKKATVVGKSTVPYDPSEFLRQVARQILAELRPPTEIKKFTSNSDVVGAYVEAGVRRFVQKYLAPIRVCSGAVIDQNQVPGSKKIPQLDTIAWIPGPVPAIFESGDFGLVPRSSALGILEIKSSAYKKGVKDIEKRTEPKFANSVTADIKDAQGREGGLLGRWEMFAMGVICLLQEDQRGNRLLEKLEKEGRVVVLFEQQGDRSVEKPEGIYRLVNFLSILRFRAAAREGQLAIDLRLVKPPVVAVIDREKT